MDPVTKWYAEPNGKPGRNPTFTDTTIQTCLVIKHLFSLPLRQTQGFVQSIIELANLDWEAPDYTTLCCRQANIQITIPHQTQTTGMDLLIDSTGIKVTGEGEWHTKKHSKSKRRTWRKVHIGIDADTEQVKAAGVTGNGIGDSPMLSELLEQIDEPINTVKADGAYDTKNVHRTIADKPAKAVILPRRNAALWDNPKHQGDNRRNEIVEQCQTIGDKVWKEQSGYHQRSLVGTAMLRFKRLGDKLMARDFARQVVEGHARIVVLNRFAILGMPVTVAI